MTMSSPAWLRSLARALRSRPGSSRRRSRKSANSPRPLWLRLEQLEDRLVPATLVAGDLVFGPKTTNFTLSQAVNQFNPSLGQLTEVDITFNGSITSTIKAENLAA